MDCVLQNRDPETVFEGDAFYGGVSRGKTTEVWGPSGVGKTAFGYVVLRDRDWGKK